MASESSTYQILTYLGEDLPEAYRNMVFSKWLRSYRYGNDLMRLIDSKSYYAFHHLMVEQLLAKPETEVRLAVLSDDADVCLGFSVSRGSILDYVHVHRDYRRTGIGRALTPKHVTVVTHLTKTGLSVWGSKFPKWKYNPYI